MDTDGDGDVDSDDEYPRQYPRRCDKTVNFPRFALSDGQRLYVADSGNDRILVFNEIPLENGAAADVVIGQLDFQSLRESDGAGSLRAPTALAHDGTNLYVADPFSRRILVFTPGEDLISREGVRNGAAFSIHSVAAVTFENEPVVDQAVTITIEDAFERFPAVAFEYTTKEGDTNLSVRDTLMEMINARAAEGGPVFGRPIEGEGVHAVGRIKFSGESQAGDVVTLRIADQVYESEVLAGDPPERMVDRLKFVIDGRRDPNVIADREFDTLDTLLLTARKVGPSGNQIPIQVSLSPGAKIVAEADESLQGGRFPYAISLVSSEDGPIGNDLLLTSEITGTGMTVTASGNRFSGGSDAQELPNGSMAAIFGEGFADAEYQPAPGVTALPTELGGVQVYTNGILSPLYSVTPEQINFQVPWQKEGTSISVYVRRTMPDGQVMVSAARATSSTRAAPGLFAFPGPEPRQGVVLHGSGEAQGTVALASPSPDDEEDEGSILIDPPGVDVRIQISNREYLYITQEGDTIAAARDNIVALINNANGGQGDPEVVAVPGQQGFFSARADVNFGGEIQPGDTVSIIVRDRIYSYIVQEGDTLVIVRNRLDQQINLGPNLDGRGDPEVTSRFFTEVGTVRLEVVARDLGTSGNSIPFAVVVTPDSAAITATTDVEEDGVLRGGQTPPVVILKARFPGTESNEITYGASSSDEGRLMVTASTSNLCCGAEPYSVVTEDNPAIPGESIIVMGTGLGLTTPQVLEEGLQSGDLTPASPLFHVPLVSDDFVASLAGGLTAQVEFVGLMPGMVGVYQVNLELSQNLPDNRNTPLTIFQGLFVSNTITFPVKNLTPRQTAAADDTN
jgi:uncharacterized protein (TIGR03437 family)